MSLLGIDVGTTGCKAAVFSTEGHQLASAYEEYDNLRPKPGWAELDAAEVWGKVESDGAQGRIRCGIRSDRGPRRVVPG